MYETGNPVPSAALEDMADNAQTFDALVTKTEGTTTDRLGRTRRVFQQILMDIGFQPLAGSFQTGATITARNQMLYDEASHVFYSWNGALPKVVTAGSTPATAGGVGVGAWVDRTDVMLRDQLAGDGGATKVGTSDGRTVEQRLAALPNEVDAAGTAASLIDQHNNDYFAHTHLTEQIAAEVGRAELATSEAEAARDAALIQAGVYVDEPTGRAAVADGVAFKVQGSGEIAAYEYRRVNSSSSTLIAAYPAISAIRRPNIFFDSFNEYIYNNPNLGGWNHFDGRSYSFSTSSANIGLKTHVASINTGDLFRRNFQFSKLKLKAGDKITVSALCYFSDVGGGSLNLYFRQSDRTILASAGTNNSAIAGIQTLSKTITVPSGSIDFLMVEVVNTSAGSGFEVGCVLGAIGEVMAISFDAPSSFDEILNWMNVSNLDSRFSEKLQFSDLVNSIEASKNLFNQNDEGYSANKYVRSSDGALQTPSPNPAAYSASGYIAVVPSETYVRSASHQMAFYDASKLFVSGRAATANIELPETFTVPANCYFARFSIPAGSLSTFQVEQGLSPTAFVPFGYVLATGAVTPSKTSFFETSKNLFNVNAADNVLGSYIFYQNGNPTANASYNATGFVPVTSGETYTISFSHQRAFYDINGVYVSGTNIGNPATFKVPANCYFARFSVAVGVWETFQVEQGSLATAFVPYGYVINSDYLPSSEVRSARLDPFLTADGAPKINPYRKELLRQTHYRLMKRSLTTPEDVQLVINAGGDSYTHNRSRWIQGFTEYLVSKFGDAGGGWCGFGFLNSGNVAPWTTGNQPSFLNSNARSTYPTKAFGNVAGTYYSGSGPDLAFATLSASGDYFTQDIPASPVHNACDLMFIGTADGVVRYSWNGGANWTNVNVQDTVGNIQTVSIIDNIPAGAGTLRVEWVSGTVKLCGVNLKSSAPGVRVNKLAATGSSISNWANAPAAQFEAAFAALSAHLFIYMDGTNSQSVAMSAATWGGHLQTIFNRVKSASPSIDILFTTPPENQRTTNTVAMSAYATEARKRALSLRFAFNDTQDAFGDASNPTEYGSSGAVPLFASDLIHPEPTTGGRALMAEILKCVLPL